MANHTYLVGDCVAPFLDASRFPTKGGYLDGRLCAPVAGLPNSPTCCLPCPAANWVYSDDFSTFAAASEWLHVLGLVLMSFMMVSFYVLPVSLTRRHYLSICLIVSVMALSLGFAIPLAVEPEQCYNEITPNDMHSNMTCAWAGSFVAAGALATSMWILIRASSMTLQICFDIVPGRKLFYVFQALGWGVPAAFFCACITASGFSYRFGSACHVNHQNSLADFWAPLVIMAGLAGFAQLVTFLYCAHVYFRNLRSDSTDPSANASQGGPVPSRVGSVQKQTARTIYRRLKKILWLQWRSLTIVTILLTELIFMAVVFVALDGTQARVVKGGGSTVTPWLLCLVTNPTDKNKCLDLTRGWVVSEATVRAVLMLVAIAGTQVFLLLTRPAIFPAWLQFIREKFSNNRLDFVSLGAGSSAVRSPSKTTLVDYQYNRRHTAFELQPKRPDIETLDLDDKPGAHSTLSSPADTYRSPFQRSQSPSLDDASLPHTHRGHFPPEYSGHITPSPAQTPNGIHILSAPHSGRPLPPEYFHDSSHDDARRYYTPPANIILSRAVSPPSRQHTPYGRGGLAMNPPSERGDDVPESRVRDGI